MTTDYIIFSDDPAWCDLERITDDERQARRQLSTLRRIPGLHLHCVKGTTDFPLTEEVPLSEECLNGACEEAA